MRQEVWGLLPDLPVGGRLPSFCHFWERNVANTWIVDVVLQGFCLEFLESPPPFQGIRWTKSMSNLDSGVLAKEVLEMLAKHAIEVVPLCKALRGYYSTFFLVPKKDGGG
jgi:hypothetical protein